MQFENKIRGIIDRNGRGVLIMASKIRKIDYYVGAFLSLIANKIIQPALIIDCTESTRIIQFDTNSGSYNVFIKYSGKPNSEKGNSKKWSFTFTEDEQQKLKSERKTNSKNLVALVCSEPSLKHTEVAVLDVKDAEACMGNDSMNKRRRIGVKYEKNRHHLRCHGTALSDKEPILASRNLDRIFV